MSSIEDVFHHLNIKDPPDDSKYIISSVCHVEVGTRVILQIIAGGDNLARMIVESEEINGFDVDVDRLNCKEMVIEMEGRGVQPKLFQTIEVRLLSGQDCHGRLIVDEFSTCPEIARHATAQRILAVSKIVSKRMVEVVGVGFATPFPAQIETSENLVDHQLIYANVYEMPKFYRATVKDGKIMYYKDIEKAKQYIELVERRSTDASVHLMAMAASFYLEDARSLSIEEQKTIDEWTRNMDILSLEEAFLYLRDPLVASGRIEEYVQKQDALAHQVKKKVRFDKERGRMEIELTGKEAYRLIVDKNLSQWRVNDEIQLVHPELVKKGAGNGMPVVIDSIRKTEKGTKVTLCTTPLSEDVMSIVKKSHIKLDEQECTIGPQGDVVYSVAGIVEKHFVKWFAHPLFDEWCGRCANEKEPFDLDDEPFLVKGIPLDKHQLLALRIANSAYGFTTVSAPPGSGKTHMISAIVANGGYTKFGISANSNNAVDNAIDAIERNFPHVTMCRDFSKKSSYLAKKQTLKHSLRKMSEKAHEYVDLNLHKKLQETINKKRTAEEDFAKFLEEDMDDTNMDDGFARLQQLRSLAKSMSKQFLKAYGPTVLASTSVLLSRQETQSTHLIIDEAAMMSPLHALALYCQIPNLQRVTLLGDSRQKTPFSRAAVGTTAHNLGILGELARVEELDSATHTQLRTVYRSHPLIVHHILNPIYDNSLVSGVTKNQRNLAKRVKIRTGSDGTPVLFMNLRDSNGVAGFNFKELDVTMWLLSILKQQLVPDSDIVVLCHHKAQREKLFIRAKKDLGKHHEIDLQTVDSYQGKEAKVVILLMTKTCGAKAKDPIRSFSFICEPHRETVAVSRAQEFMFLIGDWDNIFKTPFWSQYAKYAEEYDAMVDVTHIANK